MIFHAEADTCWSARCARSGLVVSNSIFFFRFMGKFIKKSLHSGSIRESCYFGLFWVILGYFSRRSVYGLFWYFRVILVNRVISAYSYKSCYFNVFGSFWAIFGHISGYFGSFRESIGGFVKRVISCLAQKNL